MVKKVAFWGSSRDSLPTLRLLNQESEIEIVITSPDRPKGRGKKILPSVVKEEALKLGIKEIHTPERLDKSFKSFYFSKNVDLAVVVSYGKIIPESILKFPRYKTLNIHFSLLPRWRGASPVEHAILNGDEKIGVSIIELVKKLDAGPIYSKIEIPLNKDKFAYEIREELSELGAREILKLIKNIENIKPEPQPEKGITYAPKLKKEDGFFKWDFPSIKIFRMIKAFTPWPSAYTFFKGKRLIITDAILSEKREGKAGEIFKISKEGVGVICGDNSSLTILSVKPEGKKVMSAYDFINGARLKVGDYF